MASPKLLSVIRIPRTFHEKQMHQLRQELRTQTQRSIKEGLGYSDRDPNIYQTSKIERLNPIPRP